MTIEAKQNPNRNELVKFQVESKQAQEERHLRSLIDKNYPTFSPTQKKELLQLTQQYFALFPHYGKRQSLIEIHQIALENNQDSEKTLKILKNILKKATIEGRTYNKIKNNNYNIKAEIEKEVKLILKHKNR